jgi:hypothetical protein
MCGTIHHLVIHCYPRRKARDPETGLNVGGNVVSAICAIAKAQGRQYTQRMLPDFLVPGCVIRLDATLAAVEAGIETAELLDEGCSLMGCIDERTVKRHVGLATAAIQRANLQLSHAMALTPETVDSPEVSPEKGALETLRLLLCAFVLGLARRGREERLPTERDLVQALWQREWKAKPSTCVFGEPAVADISVVHGGQSP